MAGDDFSVDHLRKLKKDAEERKAAQAKADAENAERAIEAAKLEGKALFEKAKAKMTKEAEFGFSVVVESLDYSLREFGPANAIMGEPRKNRSLRRYNVVFPIDHPWRYLKNHLNDAGLEVSFESSVTSLDERGQDVFMLVAYW